MPSAVWIVVLLTLAACGGPFRGQPLEAVPFPARAQTQEADGLRVTAAVPSEAEAEAIFGRPVYDRGVQPIWLEVENRTTDRARYAPVGTDRLYFSPMEVWYTNRKGLSSEGLADLQAHLRALQMPRRIYPGETKSGFVFTHASYGTKSFNVELFTGGEKHHVFSFFIDVPGFEPDHQTFDFAGLYGPGEVRDVDLETFRTQIADFPRVADDDRGRPTGLPVNLLFAGRDRANLTALLRAGWYEIPRPRSEREIASAPHLFGRPPDALFRRERRDSGALDELRVWLAPVRVEGEYLWLAQVTQTIGERRGLAARLIDTWDGARPDAARDHLMQGLWYAQGLEQYAWVAGAPTESGALLGGVLTGEQWKSDGFRAVLWGSGPPISLLEVRNLDWSAPPVGAAR